jgi:hypothetical protein
MFYKARRRRRRRQVTMRLSRIIEDKGKVCHTTSPESTVGSRHIALCTQAQC